MENHFNCKYKSTCIGSKNPRYNVCKKWEQEIDWVAESINKELEDTHQITMKNHLMKDIQEGNIIDYEVDYIYDENPCIPKKLMYKKIYIKVGVKK